MTSCGPGENTPRRGRGRAPAHQPGHAPPGGRGAGAPGGRVAITRRQLPDGSWSRDFPVPLDYLQRSAELAYAGNVYVAQGRTVDTAHVFVDASLSRESLYVAMTRGREANTAHVVTGPSPSSRPGAHGPGGPAGRPGRSHGPDRVQLDRNRGHAGGPGVRHGLGPPADHVLRRDPARGVRGHRRGAGRAPTGRRSRAVHGRGPAAGFPAPGPRGHHGGRSAWRRSWTWPRAATSRPLARWPP